jgi:TPR repeat protein
MNLLARCYEEGWGVARDPRQAAAWYRRSAEGGYFRGQFNFATLLAAAGAIEAAKAWFERALDGGGAADLTGMLDTLAAHSDPNISRLGRWRS